MLCFGCLASLAIWLESTKIHLDILFSYIHDLVKMLSEGMPYITHMSNCLVLVFNFKGLVRTLVGSSSAQIAFFYIVLFSVNLVLV